MRICLLTTSFPPMVGGAEFAIHNLATALHAAGHDVTVFAPRRSLRLRRHVSYTLNTLPIGTFPLLAANDRMGRLYFLASLAPLRLRHFDVLNVHFALPLAPILIRYRTFLSAPIVLTFRGTDIQRDPSIGYGLRLDPRLDARVRAAANGADAIVAISESIRRSTLELLTAPKPIFTIPNGVDLTRFDARRSTGGFRGRLGIPDDTPLILAVGRDHPVKGYRNLLEAMRIVADTPSRAWCAIVGRGVSHLHDVVTRLKLTGQVILLEEISPSSQEGPLNFPPSGIIDAYMASDICVSTSLVEGSPNVVLEAMAAGRAIVATDAPGSRDLITDGHTGLLCAPGDPKDLAAKLSMILADPSLRRRLEQNAARTAQEYAWAKIAHQYTQAFEAVIHAQDPAVHHITNV